MPAKSYGAADSVLSLSVTPTLFQMSAQAGQSWQSSIKVINNNPVPLTVYASVVNFEPQGETGEGKFLPLLDESTATATLAAWIDVTKDPIEIPPEKSVSVPIAVHIPNDVTPGGHFAAILVGTKPPKHEGVTEVGTAQIVTSLFFVRVAGDVIEDGRIREFSIAHAFTDTPKASFSVRFENKGNVLLQPQGDITITNMWGKERGVIPINHQTHFGNVLPHSIRKFDFSWEGEPSFSDIGRYTAVLTLAYGDDDRQFVTSKAYFYVIPIKAGLIVLASILAFVLFITWAIKAYVRRMLVLAGVDPMSAAKERNYARPGDVRIEKPVSIKAPVERGVLDLKRRMENARAFSEKLRSLYAFFVQYRLFFFGAAVFAIAISAGTFFVIAANKEHRNYQVTIQNAGNNVTLSSEDVLYDASQQHAATSSVPREASSTAQQYALVLVNSSDTAGAAARLKNLLEGQGYAIAKLQSDLSPSKKSTVIVYGAALQDAALALSKLLGHALLSADPTQASTTTPRITVYIGNDATF